MRVLLVEDDVLIREGLVTALTVEGIDVVAAGSVQEALALVSQRSVALAILDMQLPDGDGMAIARALAGVPVIFLTVVDDEDLIVHAFEEGAVDYVTKPFRLRELMARVKRHLPQGDTLRIGTVVLDVVAGTASIDGQEVNLTALEYRLLETLARHRGQLLSRQQILDDIWDATGNFVEDNTLTVYIKRLRDKLGDAAEIETVRGRGYRVH